MRAFPLLVFIAALTAACAGATVPGTSPGVSIPPIVLPSGIPTLPPLPDIGLPTPVNGQSPACQYVSEAEMTSLIGEAMTVSSSAGSQCTWSAADLSPNVIIRYGTAETIANGKLFAPNGRDLTIGGNPAYFSDITGALLFIEKSGRPLVVQAIWSLEGDAEVQKISQIGELAVSRF